MQKSQKSGSCLDHRLHCSLIHPLSAHQQILQCTTSWDSFRRSDILTAEMHYSNWSCASSYLHEKYECLFQMSLWNCVYIRRASPNQSMRPRRAWNRQGFSTVFHMLYNISKSLSSLSLDDSCSDEDVSHSVLVSRGCSPSTTVVPSVSPSIPIPTRNSLSCSPHGALVFSSSPTSSLPPLPCGIAPRRNPSPKNDTAFSQGSLRLSQSNRNSAISLLSMSTCSDTSYILGR